MKIKGQCRSKLSNDKHGSTNSDKGREIKTNPLLQRVSIDPNVSFGNPCIRGTRIWVSLLLDFLASGTSVEEILAEYPQLTEEDVRAAIAYGA